MAAVHFTSKAGPRRKRAAKGRTPKGRSVKKDLKVNHCGKTVLTRAGASETLSSVDSPVVGKDRRVRVQGRLKRAIEEEMRNLDRVEALLRCLWFAMEHVDLTDEGAPYFPDVVEVAAELALRSNVDLQHLHEGRVPELLKAVLKVER